MAANGMWSMSSTTSLEDFGDFYAARKDAVYRAVLVAIGSRSSAEDVVAEAFSRACGRWAAVREHPNPTAWVLRTALNLHRSWWRRLVREVPGDPPERPGPPPGQSEDLSADLRRLVHALPRRQREVVAARLLADLSSQDTAILLNISPATVDVHLHRALGTLRKRLTDSVVTSDPVRLGSATGPIHVTHAAPSASRPEQEL